MAGLNFMYTPDWSKLADPKVWLAATGQIFFTLSVGMGSLQAYASYLTKKDDIALSGIATAATNETAEVVLGGSLAIPAVVAFFGVTGAVAIAKGGGFDLGFIAMPLVFNQLPGGATMGPGRRHVVRPALLRRHHVLRGHGHPATLVRRGEFRLAPEEDRGIGLGGVAVLFGMLHMMYYTRASSMSGTTGRAPSAW